MIFQVSIGQTDQPGLFGFSDAFQRRIDIGAVRAVGTGPHLDNHKLAALLCDQVDFPERTAPIAIQNPVPRLLQRERSDRFGALSGLPFSRRISRMALAMLLSGSFRIHDTMGMRPFRRRVQEPTMSVVTVLKQADIFYELTTTQLELIASICEERHYETGDLVFAENSRGDELYVIANGQIDIQLDPALVSGEKSAGELQTVATLRRGQSFGEIALVDEGRRSASARASLHDTHLIAIPREKLMLLCDTYPQLGFRLMRNLAADLAMKIRNADLRVREQLIWAGKQETR